MLIKLQLDAYQTPSALTRQLVINCSLFLILSSVSNPLMLLNSIAVIKTLCRKKSKFFHTSVKYLRICPHPPFLSQALSLPIRGTHLTPLKAWTTCLFLGFPVFHLFFFSLLVFNKVSFEKPNLSQKCRRKQGKIVHFVCLSFFPKLEV